MILSRVMKHAQTIRENPRFRGMLVGSRGAIAVVVIGGGMRYWTLFLLLAFSGAASAYCPHVGVRAEFYDSDIVVTGKVVSEQKVSGNQVPNGWYGGETYKVMISDVYRGDVGKAITIFSENSSGRMPMDVGTSWLIFAVLLPGKFGGLHVYQMDCGGNSGRVQKKGKVLSEVHRLENKGKSIR